MAQVETAPYGHWDSPLTAERMATENIEIHTAAADVGAHHCPCI